MLILADDYTGAADAAVGLVVKGYSATILLDEQDIEVGSGIVALDLDTRHLSPHQAHEAVRNLLSKAGTDSFIFKKIDSTLRGQIGPEIRALSEANADASAPILIAPAVPENGRIVVGGEVFVRGVPLQDTDVWKHERATVEADRPARISQYLSQSNIRTGEIHLQSLREGADALKSRLLEQKAAGIEAVVLDAETSEDLAIIADTAMSFAKTPVCVGAAGLSATFDRMLASADLQETPTPPANFGPVLLAIASQSQTARDQINAVAARSDVTSIEIGSDIEAKAAKAADALAKGLNTLLFSPLASQDGLSRDYAGLMASTVALIADQATALIASGGDTARACLMALGYNRITVDGEIAAGVVLGHPVDRPDFAFVSKAGDFGEKQTLSNCIDLLTPPSQGTET